MARGEWGADYSDPMTFLDMFVSDSPNNEIGYKNTKYDELIAVAKKETDANKRLGIMHQTEDLLMEEMPIIPLYYDIRPGGVKNYVKGLRVSPLGYWFFDKAYVEGEK